MMSDRATSIVVTLCLSVTAVIYWFYLFRTDYYYTHSIHNGLAKLSPNRPHINVTIVRLNSSHRHHDAFTTVVSQYFALAKSKHSPGEYTEWILHMLESVVDAPLVIYTDHASLAFLSAHRRQRNGTQSATMFIVYESIWEVMRELETERNMLYLHKYQASLPPLDPERSSHSPDLYAIWNAKTYMTAKVARLNPYRSEFFMYTDAGGWRERTIPQWPDNAFARNVSRVLGPERMLLGQVNSLRSDVEFSSSHDYIQGAFFAGSAAALSAYEREFYALHDKWLLDGRFVGKDQRMMNELAFVTYAHGVVRLRLWHNECASPWFFYQRYFARVEYYKCPEADRYALLIQQPPNASRGY